MFSGKTMIGMALGIVGASVYYRSRNTMAYHQDESIGLKKDMLDLKALLCNLESMVNKLDVK